MRRPVLTRGVRTLGVLALGVFAVGAALISGAGGGCQGCEETPGGAPPAAENSPAPAATALDGGANDAGEPELSVAGAERDPTGVRRCCLAIAQNVAAAPAEHKATWQAAFLACNRAAEGDAGR